MTLVFHESDYGFFMVWISTFGFSWFGSGLSKIWIQDWTLFLDGLIGWFFTIWTQVFQRTLANMFFKGGLVISGCWLYSVIRGLKGGGWEKGKYFKKYSGAFFFNSLGEHLFRSVSADSVFVAVFGIGQAGLLVL